MQHAGAERAEITASFMDTSVSLDVVDDGRGFDLASAPGQGTAVAVTLPLPTEAAS